MPSTRGAASPEIAKRGFPWIRAGISTNQSPGTHLLDKLKAGRTTNALYAKARSIEHGLDVFESAGKVGFSFRQAQAKSGGEDHWTCLTGEGG